MSVCTILLVRCNTIMCLIKCLLYSLSLPIFVEGHGTHVSGTVAGNSMGDFGEMDGMAPDAKISFFDIGKTQDYFYSPSSRLLCSLFGLRIY